MRLTFYAPFKPLDHHNPSGDLMIARELFAHLEQQNNQLIVASSLRSRWIFWKPGKLVKALLESRRLIKSFTANPVDLWLTYHCYYKAPDLIGPTVCKRLGIPYVIFQPSYATKFRKQWKTKPGFYLNRRALTAADLTITNRRHDLINLERIIPRERLSFIKPGIQPQHFHFCEKSRREMHDLWQVGNRPVILTAAMFRPDVKSEGIAWVIESCCRLHARGYRFVLVIAGDGQEKTRLQKLATKLPPDMVVFTGKIQREQMYRFYSGGDLFVFPGFRESLGMVFLEAQSCGLPIIACRNGGIPEVVVHGKSGLLSHLNAPSTFDANIASLLDNPVNRKAMGLYAADHVREHHDINTNYQGLNEILKFIAQSKQYIEGSH